MVKAFAHGAMGRRIDASWDGPIDLFLVRCYLLLLILLIVVVFLEDFVDVLDEPVGL